MHDTTSQVPLLMSRQHFGVLDGLRGIAAVAVVVFHFMEIAVPDYNNSFIAHAYLAVDFFFCLSGFVIAYAYDQRIARTGKATFLKLRLIRLHPLVIIGSLIGLAVFISDPFSTLFQAYAGKTLGMFLSSCLMIPYPLVHERYFNLFHLNPPTWSLFWEYIVNICYAFFLFRMRNKITWILTALAAIALCYEAKQSGYLGVGWGGDNIAGGAIRVCYSFLAGILVYRSGWIIRSKAGFVSTGILLLAVFLIPFSGKFNYIIDPLVVIFLFPLLVTFGAGAQVNAATRKICKWSGELSYPLYMIHYPFIWLFMSYVEKEKPGVPQMTLIMITGTAILILLAYLVLVYLDAPLRQYFKNRMETRAAQLTP